jgi:thioredoxin 1
MALPGEVFSMSDKVSPVHSANEHNFQELVVDSEIPVLLDVSAAWCAPCKAAAPVVAELARRYQGRLRVVEIDGGESPGLTARLKVRGFPTFLGFVGGNIVERRAGFGGAKSLEALAEALLAAKESLSA